MQLQELISQSLELHKEQFLYVYNDPALLFNLKELPSKQDIEKTQIIIEKEPLESFSLLDFQVQDESKISNINQQIIWLTPSQHFTTLGRGRDNKIIITHPGISLAHAFFTLLPRSGLWTVSDAISTNGTTLNDEPLQHKKPYILRNRAKLVFGKSVSAFYLEPKDLWELVVETSIVSKQ